MASDDKEVQGQPAPLPNPDIPDPDEDDLDDLDEMLDEFSSTKIEADETTRTTSTPDASGPGRPTGTGFEEPPGLPSLEESDFAKELQQGMAEMLKELDANPDMAKQFEDMLAQFGAAGPILPPQAQAHASSTAAASIAQPPKPAPTPTSAGADPSATATKSADDNFQDTIRRTMDRMKASSSSADAAATGPSASEDDMMASLLRELQSANGGPEGEGDDTFSKMLLGMMEQLTNKEILYEPMKELDTKFPSWLALNEGKLAEEDEKRYKEQRDLVRAIVERFERKGYSDGNAQDREFIVEQMQKMQAAGAPPPDLVGDMGAAEGLMGDMDAGCPQQ